MNRIEQHSSLTAARYTLYSWVLFLLPLTFGIILATVYDWSYFWTIVVIALGFFVLINNVLVIAYRLYNRSASKMAILVQVYFACLFGLMILGKAYPQPWLDFVLVTIFLINALLGIIYRKNIYDCGWYSKLVLLVTTSFPIAFAQYADYYDWSIALDAPALISSIAAGFTYYTGTLVNSYYRP